MRQRLVWQYVIALATMVAVGVERVQEHDVSGILLVTAAICALTWLFSTDERMD